MTRSPCVIPNMGGYVCRRKRFAERKRELSDFDQIREQSVALAPLHVGDMAPVPLPVLGTERDVIFVDVCHGAGTPSALADGIHLPELSQSDAGAHGFPT